MLTHTRTARARRRGVVLVLILAMLGLLAVIGVTFATFSGQTQVGARNYADSFKEYDPEQYIDFGLDQLINDTNNPLSALRGHSLKLDMYGNDSGDNGVLPYLPNGDPIIIARSTTQLPASSGQFVVDTNIPFNASNYPELYNRLFNGWVLRLELWLHNNNGYPVSKIAKRSSRPLYAQTFQVLNDTVFNGFHRLQLSARDAITPDLVQPDMTLGTNEVLHASLDGRFRHAFNGTGTAGQDLNNNGEIDAIEANFRFSGLPGTAVAPFTPLDPGNAPMDEDYDAPDLENWFLSIQSADGSIELPSFHRPAVVRRQLNPTTGALVFDDWLAWPLDSTKAGYKAFTAMTAAEKIQAASIWSRFLRPRSVDHPQWDTKNFPDPRPDWTGSPNPAAANFNANYGKVVYDVDNDGDGTKESVWIDLGFPVQRDPKTGKYFKPLFAFKVEGLNGKLPLNSAGNLQKRAADGTPAVDHASHIGYSPSEINPKYAFTNGPPSIAAARTGTEQLQKMLQGFIDATTGQVVDGRWGESALLSTGVIFPRAGRTVGPNWPIGSPSDDNYGSLDFMPAQNAATNPTTYPEKYDSDDSEASGLPIVGGALGGILLPSERYRKFVTPLDVTGNGRQIAWHDDPASLFFASLPALSPVGYTYPVPAATIPPVAGDVPPHNLGAGFDSRGRHGFFQYFRPPGLPPAYDPGGQALWKVPTVGTQPLIVANTHNQLHGFEAWRNPLGMVGGSTTARQMWGAMPWNTGTGTTPPPRIPSYSLLPGAEIGAQAPAPGRYGVYPGTSAFDAGPLDRDLADEMNLYSPGQADRPFLGADLDWLYRGLSNDPDAADLESRLAGLLPEVFGSDSKATGALSKDDARGRRKLFSHETWDLNSFAWANDNPGARYDTTATATVGQYVNNSRFSGTRSPGKFVARGASFEAMGIAGALNPVTHQGVPVATNAPAVAHRDRRINLNAPLPSTPIFDANGDRVDDPGKNPIEPVRQKWIREAYATMKAVLPPKSVDTPEELAQLSQFAVNIIDFRDPDDTITKFVNTDLLVTPASGQTSARLAYNTSTTTPAIGFDPSLVEADGYLVQYGMEYPAVAINEALAYAFNTSAGSKSRFFVELVNTLTKDGGDLSTADWPAGTVSATDLALAGWDIAVTVEDGTADGLARPDPYTGQVPAANTTFKRAPVARPLDDKGTADPSDDDPAGLVDGSGNPVRIPALPDESGEIGIDYGPTPPEAKKEPRYFFVLGYKPGTGVKESDPNKAWPTGTGVPQDPFIEPNAILRDPTDATQEGQVSDLLDEPITAAASQYIWVYLRRPLFPNQPYDPATNPMVVVDSMRLPYFKADTGTYNTTSGATEDPQHIWAAQRMQPWRGGQGVPNPTVGAGTPPPLAFGRAYQPDPAQPNYCLYDPTWAAYGASEQLQYTDAGVDRKGLFDPTNTNSKVTKELGESLGRPNRRTDRWDGIVFNDRDFQSVGELLLVPGCPPGLFTKQFVEEGAPDAADLIPRPPHAASTWPNTSVPLAAPSGDPDEGDSLSSAEPHRYPFLVDKFYYGADGQDARDNAADKVQVGGPTGNGWHKLLEFFEVPSPVLGSIGPVGLGENRDWYREDRRPGLVNLNLIVDEEVFFGVFDDARLKAAPVDPTVDTSQIIPRVVTQVDLNYDPVVDHTATTTTVELGSYAIRNRGYFKAGNAGSTLMSQAFADFLRLRHGNPNAIYAMAPDATAVWDNQRQLIASNFLYGGKPEAPFHSLSYPDIRYTILRPADPVRTASDTDPSRNWDNGLLQPYDPALAVLRPARIPPLRLFQVPDSTPTLGAGTPPQDNPASLLLAGGTADLYGILSASDRPTLADHPIPYPTMPQRAPMFLGGSTRPGNDMGTPDPSDDVPGIDDNREHPAFRTEWLQKVMNLTTVRTHQYAVWVTVGLFEVTRPGDPEKVSTQPEKAYDQLGKELVNVNGESPRYRMFAIIDRTRAAGFDYNRPGDFRDLVVYTKRIQ